MGRAVGEGGELEVGVRLKAGRHCVTGEARGRP